MTGGPGLLLDAMLCLALVLLCWRTVNARGLFESVALFMVFGLLMAVVWARLGSPDLALAEAAIGAGFTGALLLVTCREVKSDDARAGPLPSLALPRWLPDWAALTLCLGIGLGLGAVMALGLPAPDTTADAAATAAGTHPMGNAVTAVLLDFRGYDTLLEMVVLLLAAVGIRELVDGQPLPDPHPSTPVADPMLQSLLIVVCPLLVATALYLLVTGATGPGGAFQAGALLGALGVLLRLAGRLVAASAPSLAWRCALVVGLGCFLLMAVLSPFHAGMPMSYPPVLAYPVMLVVETALMISIAATLVLLFGSAPGLRLGRRR